MSNMKRSSLNFSSTSLKSNMDRIVNKGNIESLLVRNQQLINTVTKLKDENRDLKNITRLNNYKYFISKNLKLDVSTQTTEDEINDLIKSTEVLSINDTNDVATQTDDNSNCNVMSENNLTTKSPAKQRVENQLVNECQLISNQTKSKRIVSKPISYKEPSLKAKVRKGFQFFKFDTK